MLCSSKNRLDKTKDLEIHIHNLIPHSAKERSELAISHGGYNTYGCNICQKSKRGFSVMCSICQFDVCRDCWEIYKGVPPETSRIEDWDEIYKEEDPDHFLKRLKEIIKSEVSTPQV